jgi:hypothetical protein
MVAQSKKLLIATNNHNQMFNLFTTYNCMHDVETITKIHAPSEQHIEQNTKSIMKFQVAQTIKF